MSLSCCREKWATRASRFHATQAWTKARAAAVSPRKPLLPGPDGAMYGEA